MVIYIVHTIIIIGLLVAIYYLGDLALSLFPVHHVDKAMLMNATSMWS